MRFSSGYWGFLADTKQHYANYAYLWGSPYRSIIPLGVLLGDRGAVGAVQVPRHLIHGIGNSLYQKQHELRNLHSLLQVMRIVGTSYTRRPARPLPECGQTESTDWTRRER